MSTPQTIAVTGATGFVGRHVVRALVERGYGVRALVRDRVKAAKALGASNAEVRWTLGDIFDPGAMRELAAGAEAMVHTVGIRREFRPEVTFERLHAGATRAALEAAQSAGVVRFVHISALGTRPEARCAYHRSKFEAEALVRRSGLAWTILRPSLIHGPDGEFMRMVKDWALGRAAPWFILPYFSRVRMSDGLIPTPRFSAALVQPVWVEDVAGAVVAALESERAVGEVYHLGGAEALDWPTMLRAIRDALPLADRRMRVIGIPGLLAWIKAAQLEVVGLGRLLPFGPSEPIMATEDSVCAPDKAREHLGFEPGAFRATMEGYAADI